MESHPNLLDECIFLEYPEAVIDSVNATGDPVTLTDQGKLRFMISPLEGLVDQSAVCPQKKPRNSLVG